MGMAIIIPAAKCDLQLTSQQTGLLTSISFLGIMVSAHLWGFLADTQGRKKIILYTMLLSNLCTVISSLSVNFDMLIVSRFFTGFL
jgi:MFS transporter, VNT family, synaptic vesicle glycoprotein 2